MTKGTKQNDFLININSISQNRTETPKILLTKDHIKCLVEALIDRYTMRSKAHKKLISEFIRIVLDLSQQEVAKKLMEEAHLQERNLGRGDLSTGLVNVHSPDHLNFHGEF
mmetsp:Transcript_23110/g.22525  ORF Transcript_23110/g.22525 Transcript_23110/m.22525 type:complete len:111 (-) Transcript_23110:609-941(-)